MGQESSHDYVNFAFDYELLDKLLNLGQTQQSTCSSEQQQVQPTPTPVSTPPSWFSEELDSAAVLGGQQQDEDSLSQVYTYVDSTRSVTEDPFDLEWAELSKLLTVPVEAGQSVLGSSGGFGPSLDSASNEALALNRQLQSQVRSLLVRTRSATGQQADMEKALGLVSGQLLQKLKRRRVQVPQFLREPPSLAGLNRLVEQHTGQSVERPAAVAVLERYFQILRVQTRWSPRERQNLVRGIKSQNEKLLLDIILQRGQYTVEEAQQILAYADERDLLMNVSGLDWEVIARHFVVSRSATDCRLQWTVCDHPMINQSPLLENKAELKRLGELARSSGSGSSQSDAALPDGFCHPWQYIAARLETNRTAFQCFCMYQRALNASLLKGKWTPDEDALLLEAVKQLGTGNWVAVAELIEGRTGQQCLHRYEKALNPHIKRGHWAPEEDELLRKAVEAAGSSQLAWTQIRKAVPGRTDVQCRERWVNVLNPELRAEPFTAEEDRKLEALVEVYGTSQWSKVAAEMAGRTDNMCWRRWKVLSRTGTAKSNTAKKPTKTTGAKAAKAVASGNPRKSSRKDQQNR